MFSELKFSIQIDFFENKKYTYDEYIDIGIEHLEHMARCFEKDMRACINVNTTDQLIIDGDWFPELRIDVFLAHLWRDDGMQLAFVGWLYSTFGLRCMIDSYVWDSLKKLTDEYNGIYCNRRRKTNGGEVLDYGSGTRVLNHIMSMLHVASVKMMDKAEAVIFFNTDDIQYICENRTFSRRYLPWVYTENVIANYMRIRPLNEYRSQDWDMTAELNGISKVSEYISEDELEQWEQTYTDKEEHPLDTLYKLLNIM